MLHFLTIAFLVLLGAPLVRAESRDSAEYRDAINLGIAEFDERHFLEARSHFSRAHELYPNARTVRALGMVAFELRRYAEAAGYLEQALNSHERALDAEQREQSQKLLARAHGYIARLTLDISPDTAVIVDGRESNLTSGSLLVLEAGDHELEFHAADQIGERRTLKVVGGEQSMLRVRLVPATATHTASKDAPSPAPSPPKRVYKNPWLWTALGVVVAGAAAGTAVALTRGVTTRTRATYVGTDGAEALVAP